MAVKFIIDSASDVLPNECKKLGAVHVPLTVRFGEKEFADASALFLSVYTFSLPFASTSAVFAPFPEISASFSHRFSRLMAYSRRRAARLSGTLS